jgi:CRISPR system Cascade subunit CasC
LDISELVGKLAENKEVLLAGSDDPHYKAFVKDLKKIFSGGGKAYAADIALFGRMFANDKSMNVDAACQVAHSISSHKVAMDIDYFTAVDDLNSDSESGAGMIGYTEMNGSCHYRYANINVPLLFSNLGFDSDLTSATIRGFVESFIGSIPTGKQNSMAAHNPPYAVSVIIRDDGKLWNLAGAFSNPVVITPEKSVEEISNEKMKEYWEGLKKAYGVPESIIQTGFTISHDGGSLLNTLEVVQNSIESMISEWNN